MRPNTKHCETFSLVQLTFAKEIFIMTRPSSRPQPEEFHWVGDDATVNSFDIGVAGDKFGVLGADPVVQPASALQAAPAAYATGAFGLDSDANMEALYDLVVQMRSALVGAGIMKGAA